ncbi:cupin domain-containing protein [Ensifer adhaerens]|uniref:cupin domain-containing protein n=1 Tax=Ensifer adhaerens TaxID=106592 RepID=UPI001CBA85C1|nr:cupin domain-containing protein [Ensifer adhaerens]MBZ7924871.1 cupin domain-containing protein [Ensifer adhaerens]UAX95914.1 cupin domain-containing protein [Ensifer adhaerens]UAY04744.1 cupin domain-containing protein [Ensifer adhaerens]UAY10175.1 cupin domain-containing protein [Ensifer adhaerens]
MSLLKTINTKNLSDGRQSRISDDRRLEGDPLLTTWEQDTYNGRVNTGVFQAEPGKNISRKGTNYEFCYILEGVVEITEDGKDAVIYRAGDSFVMKPGFVGTWRTIETMKKIYVTMNQSG